MSLIPFGKFSGKDIDEIPNTYLRWLVEQDWFEKQYSDLLTEVESELEYRNRWDIVIAD